MQQRLLSDMMKTLVANEYCKVLKENQKHSVGIMCSLQTVKDNIGLSVLKKDDGDDCVIQHLHIHAFC